MANQRKCKLGDYGERLVGKTHLIHNYIDINMYFTSMIIKKSLFHSPKDFSACWSVFVVGQLIVGNCLSLQITDAESQTWGESGIKLQPGQLLW